jgi:hypothetical protein
MKTQESGKISEIGEQPAGSEDLDPRLKLFELNLNSLCAWEEATGRNFGTFAPESMKDLRMLVLCGLKTQIPDVTIEEVGSMITPKSIPALTALIGTMAGTKP